MIPRAAPAEPAPLPSRELRSAVRELALDAALATAAFVVLLVRFSPSWITFRSWWRAPEEFGYTVEVRRAMTVLAQVRDPGIAVRDAVHGIVRWRLLVPWVAHALHWPAALTLGLAAAGAMVVLAALIGLARRRGLPRLPHDERVRLGAAEALALALVCGAGGWFFSLGWLGYYDSLLLLGLLTTAWSSKRWKVAGACVLTPWVDERFLLGFPLALAVRWASASEPRPRLLPWLVHQAAAPAFLLLGYAAVRLHLAGSHGSPGLAAYASSGTPQHAGLARIAYGAWQGLRVGWLPIVGGLVALRGSRAGSTGAMLALAAAGTTAVGLAAANDLSRSMILLVPLVPLGWGFARATRLGTRARLILPAAALLLPAQLVVSDFTLPVHWLGYELALLRHPPAVFSADTYIARAGAALFRHDLEAAAQQAALAIRLDPGSAEAHNVLGVVLARAGDAARAEAEMREAVRLAPGDAAYRSNLRRLMTRAPAGGEETRAGEPPPPP